MKWQKARLDSVADLCLGKMLDQNKNRGELLPYLANVNVRWGKFDLVELREMRFEAHEIDRYGLRAGDIVMCEGGEPGRCALWNDQMPGLMIQKALHRIRPNESLDNRFLYYTFLQKGRTHGFGHLFTGATIKHLPGQNLAKLEIEFPIRPVQQRIAAILSAYDDAIENNRRRMALLEKAARLLYEEWFVRLRFPGYEHTRVKDGVPEGWERRTIGDFIQDGLVHLQTGPFGTQLSASDYTEDGTPVINVRNIGYGDLRADKLEFVPEETAERLRVHLLRPGDIVFGRKGAVDRHLFVTAAYQGWMQGSDCIRLRSFSEAVCTTLLSFAFRLPSHHEWILGQCGNKATMASLNHDVISRIPILVPPPLILHEFRSFATECVAQISNLTEQNQKLRAARDLLLPRLMSGEIEVS